MRNWNQIDSQNNLMSFVIASYFFWEKSKEMEREKNLLLHGTGEALPPEMAAHPVFLTNIKTNNVVSKKRSKVRVY